MKFASFIQASGSEIIAMLELEWRLSAGFSNTPPFVLRYPGAIRALVGVDLVQVCTWGWFTLNYYRLQLSSETHPTHAPEQSRDTLPFRMLFKYFASVI